MRADRSRVIQNKSKISHVDSFRPVPARSPVGRNAPISGSESLYDYLKNFPGAGEIGIGRAITYTIGQPGIIIDNPQHNVFSVHYRNSSQALTFTVHPKNGGSIVELHRKMQSGILANEAVLIANQLVPPSLQSNGYLSSQPPVLPHPPPPEQPIAPLNPVVIAEPALSTQETPLPIEESSKIDDSDRPESEYAESNGSDTIEPSSDHRQCREDMEAAQVEIEDLRNELRRLTNQCLGLKSELDQSQIAINPQTKGAVFHRKSLDDFWKETNKSHAEAAEFLKQLEIQGKKDQLAELANELRESSKRCTDATELEKSARATYITWLQREERDRERNHDFYMAMLAAADKEENEHHYFQQLEAKLSLVQAEFCAFEEQTRIYEQTGIELAAWETLRPILEPIFIESSSIEYLEDVSEPAEVSEIEIPPLPKELEESVSTDTELTRSDSLLEQMRSQLEKLPYFTLSAANHDQYYLEWKRKNYKYKKYQSTNAYAVLSTLVAGGYAALKRLLWKVSKVTPTAMVAAVQRGMEAHELFKNGAINDKNLLIWCGKMKKYTYSAY